MITRTCYHHSDTLFTTVQPSGIPSSPVGQSFIPISITILVPALISCLVHFLICGLVVSKPFRYMCVVVNLHILVVLTFLACFRISGSVTILIPPFERSFVNSRINYILRDIQNLVFSVVNNHILFLLIVFSGTSGDKKRKPRGGASFSSF